MNVFLKIIGTEWNRTERTLKSGMLSYYQDTL